MSVVYDPKVRTTYTDDVATLRESHMLLLEVPVTPSLPDKGYTRRTLFIDLDTLTVKEKPITEEMIDISITQPIAGLIEVLHRLVDPVFRLAAIYLVAIDRVLEAAAEGVRPRLDAAQEIPQLLVAQAGGPLLRRPAQTDRREQERSR